MREVLAIEDRAGDSLSGGQVMQLLTFGPRLFDWGWRFLIILIDDLVDLHGLGGDQEHRRAFKTHRTTVDHLDLGLDIRLGAFGFDPGALLRHHDVDGIGEGHDLQVLDLLARESEAGRAQAHGEAVVYHTTTLVDVRGDDVHPTHIAPVVRLAIDPLPAVPDDGSVHELVHELFHFGFGEFEADEQSVRAGVVVLGALGADLGILADSQGFEHGDQEGVFLSYLRVQDETLRLHGRLITDRAVGGLAVDQPADLAEAVGADLVTATLAAFVAFSHTAVVVERAGNAGQGNVGIGLAHSNLTILDFCSQVGAGCVPNRTTGNSSKKTLFCQGFLLILANFIVVLFRFLLRPIDLQIISSKYRHLPYLLRRVGLRVPLLLCCELLQ